MPRNRSEKLPAIPENLAQYRDALIAAVAHIDVCNICDAGHLQLECGAGSRCRREVTGRMHHVPYEITTADTWSDLLDKTLAYIKTNYAAPKKVQTDAAQS